MKTDWSCFGFLFDDTGMFSLHRRAGQAVGRGGKLRIPLRRTSANPRRLFLRNPRCGFVKKAVEG